MTGKWQRNLQTTFTIRAAATDLYRIDWTQVLLMANGQACRHQGVVWSDEFGNYLVTANAGQETNAEPQR